MGLELDLMKNMASTKYERLEMERADKDETPSSIKSRPKPHRSLSKRVWILGFLIGIALFLWSLRDAKKRLDTYKKPCKPTIGYKAPKINIWADLDEDELDDILTFLYEVPNKLNLTRPDKAGP